MTNNGTYTPKEHEELFDIKPIGVRYICEYCNEGEMIYDRTVIIDQLLKKHTCNHCNGELLLPKVYPYIEWIPEV